MRAISKIIKPLVNSLIGISLLAYPFLVFFGLKFYSLKVISISLLSLFLLRLLLVKKGDQISLTMGIIGVTLMASSFIIDSQNLILYYPVLISITLLIFFSVSLIKPPTIIEKIARLTDKDFSEKAIPYTRKVTIVWMLFFIANAVISAYTVYLQNMEVWTVYNGLISYLIMAGIFFVEFLVRQRVKKSHANDTV